MPRWHTVTPLHYVDLDVEARFDFAGGLVLTILPDWIRKQRLVKSLSSEDRQALELATHGFVVSYDAASLGDPDPEWKGAKPKSIQEGKYELTLLANLALWLSRPCPVCFIVVLHAPQFDSEPTVQRITQHSPLLCHPGDPDARITAQEMDLAGRLNSSLVSIHRDTAVWTAVRATWAGLQMNIEEIRYSLFWIAIEALFGPEDAREITYRLSQRVALFLAKDRSAARELFAKARSGYGFRSKVVHGRWKENAKSQVLMADAERLVRESLLRLLQDDELMNAFCGKKREAFLDDLIFSVGNG
jgi:hypothetical protein